MIFVYIFLGATTTELPLPTYYTKTTEKAEINHANHATSLDDNINDPKDKYRSVTPFPAEVTPFPAEVTPFPAEVTPFPTLRTTTFFDGSRPNPLKYRSRTTTPRSFLNFTSATLPGESNWTDPFYKYHQTTRIPAFTVS